MYRHEGAVPELEPVHRAVAPASQPLAERVVPERVQGAAVGDDEHGLAGVRGDDAVRRRQHARADLLVGLAVVLLVVGEARVDLLPREALPRAEVALPEAGVEPDLVAGGRGDDLGRLARAAQVAGVDRVEPRPGPAGARARPPGARPSSFSSVSDVP